VLVYDPSMRVTPFLIALAACTRPAATEPTLRAQTQALLDAVTHGDPSIWDRYLDPDVTYVAEDGTIETKASLLPQLTPLPPGITGSLVVESFTVHEHGDTAVVIHVDRESESYFGQHLTAKYVTTAVWRRRDGRWRLIANQVHVQLSDPPALTLPPDQLDAYTGTYRLTDAIGYTIRREGDRLVGERTGRPPQALRVEARDVLFVPGAPRSRKVFLRDPNGSVTGFADRREGHDVVWTKQR